MGSVPGARAVAGPFDFATFTTECALAREAAAGRSLDDTFLHPGDGTTIDLRWVYVHMIEEYARHNGHARAVIPALGEDVGGD
jgi:hypothetical protein